MLRRWTERLTSRLARRWRQRVRVYLGTQRVAVDLLAHGKRLVRAVTLPIEAGTDVDAALAVLADALGALRSEIGDLAGLRCDVVLADAWVVYDVVPLDFGRVKAPAAELAIGATLSDVAGLRADELVIRWQMQRHGRGAFAMALPRVWLTRLLAVLAAEAMPVASVTGEFVSVFNAQRETLQGRRAVLAVGREAGAQIAVIADGVVAATRFELGHTSSSALSTAAAGVMRARGDDTTAPIDFVLDAGGGAPEDDTRWTRVTSPAWAAANR